MSIRLLVALIASFLLSLLLGPFVIRAASKLRAGQPILHYVSEHNAKAGTPTFGGWIFIMPTAAVTFIMTIGLSMARVAVIAMLGYAVIGFLDDFLKIKRKDNGGLRPYQKIVSQLGVAAVLCWYVWRNGLIGDALYVPFWHSVRIGVWIMPLVALTYIAGTNAVNLTDGLDGLAGSVTAVVSVGAAVMLLLTVGGADGDTASQLAEMALFAVCLSGALGGFLLYNTSPASIFMGDTGSMALGGAVCSMMIFSRMTLYLPVIGITYALSCITVIVQVGYFKLTKGKRLFLMAPMHHHLQRKGMSEAKVCALYVAMTCVAAAICVAGVYVGRYGLA